MSNLTKLCFLISCFFLISLQVKAGTLRVPSQYATIQQAINTGQNGDTVLVAPGTYVENINFSGKAITLISEAGPQTTIIDGNQLGSVVTFRSGEERNSVISGFTIRNGLATFDFRYNGGGIHLFQASPTIKNNIIKDNTGMATGGGIGMEYSSPLIQGNIISNNHTRFSGTLGGGIQISFSFNVEVLDNLISQNSADSGGGISLYLSDGVKIHNNTIKENSGFYDGGGMWVTGYAPSVIQNLIILNSAGKGGGIYWSVDGSEVAGIYAYVLGTQTQWRNNIIVASQGQTAFSCDTPSLQPIIFKSNNVFSQGGKAFSDNCPNQTGINGNISVNPLFINPATNNYHLQAGSPSIDTGDNTGANLPVTDFDKNPRIFDGDHNGTAIIDMGVYEFGSGAFDLCIQDDSNKDVVRINTTTGAYQLTRCRDGFTISGTGIISKRGCTISFQDSKSDRRIMATIDSCQNKANASIHLFAQGSPFSLNDRDITNNTCSCAGSK
jgi:serine protease